MSTKNPQHVANISKNVPKISKMFPRISCNSKKIHENVHDGPDTIPVIFKIVRQFQEENVALHHHSGKAGYAPGMEAMMEGVQGKQWEELCEVKYNFEIKYMTKCTKQLERN